MDQAFWVGGPLPGLNELLAAKGAGRGRHNAYARLKREWTERLGAAILEAELTPVGRAHFLFEWHERSKRRDPDNVAAGGRKLVLDALVICGVIKNDGWGEVAGWNDSFRVEPRRPGVMVTLSEVQ